MPIRMFRVLPTLFLFGLGLPLLAEPAAPPPGNAERAAAAAVQAPALPQAPPSPPSPPPSPPSLPPAAPANAAPVTAPVAPPLPGQLKATPAAPRPALAPPNRIPDLPKPALTPAPSVPLNKGSGKQASSTSSTGQFIVHGDDLKLRSAFSGRCEEVSTSLRQLLRDKEPWELPIVVLLKTGDAAKVPGPAASYTISQITNGGFHLQVNFNIRGDLRPTDLRAKLILVLLAERILRHQKELASNRERLLPDWIYVGIQEAMDYRQRARPSALFAAIFKSGKIYGIEEIIEASAASIEDGLSKTIYQTSCCALVLALLDQPDGGLRMGKFLSSLASDKRSERELLNQWFPGFAATPASLNKWWSLQLANLASPSISEPLSATETAKQLEEALTIRYRARSSEIPQPRPVMAIAKLETAETAPKAQAKPKAGGPAAAPAEAVEATEEKKRSLFRRLLTFGRKPRTDSEVIEDASAQAALAEAKPAASAKPAADDEAVPEPAAPRGPVFQDHTPLLDRFFTSDKKSQAKNEAAPAPPAVESAPANDTEPTSKDKTKPSPLNPLNWFRGGKKDKPEDKDKDQPETPVKAPAAKREGAAAWKPSASDLLWAWSPLAGDLYRDILQPRWQSRTPRQVEGFLGLKFGKKKDKPEADTPKTEEAKPKDSKKSEVPAAKPGEPAKEEPAAGEPQPPPAPIKIKPLFGAGKKTAPESTAAEEKAKPAETATKAAAKPTGDALANAALPIEDYGVIMKRQDRVEILKRNLNALAGLQTRAAVLFRPIINEYGEVLAGLIEGKTKGVDERLQSLRTRSIKALEQTKAVRDFLDVYEANESPVFSGLFDDYLKLPDTIEKELPARTDPLSNYLDALDREFSGR